MPTTSGMTPVVATGTTPPTVTLSGSPAPTVTKLHIDIVAGGTLGVATFRYSLDNATTWSSTTATAASSVLGASGLTAAFLAGTYNADNLYRSDIRNRFAWGGVEYPLTSTVTNPLLQDADPAVFWMREFFAAIIQTHIGDRLTAQATEAGAAIPDAVAHRSNVDPGPFLTQDPRKRYPLLALYRKTSTYEERTVVWDEEIGVWELAYVMPPLTWDQAEKILPIFGSVAKVIHRGVRQRSDASFLDGANVSSSTYASISKIRLTASKYGRFQDASGLMLHAWIGTLEVREMARPAMPTAFEDYAGADVDLDLHDNATNTTIADMNDFATDVPTPVLP